MGICLSGFNKRPTGGVLCLKVSDYHPLILLARNLPWRELADLVVTDLKVTTAKGYWYMGRKIQVRTHLGAYLLQKLYDLTDRKTEYQLKDNGAFQLFCGAGAVENWHAPDHTKIEEFRNRLSPETQREIANALAKHAVSLGFADPSDVDIDSTVQEANISYPSDAGLMLKLARMSSRVIKFFKGRKPHSKLAKLKPDIRNIAGKARGYFFLSKNTSLSRKRKVFKELHALVKSQIKPFLQRMSRTPRNGLPWNVQRSLNILESQAWRYILDVAHFIRHHTIRPSKILSWHAREVTCIRKGKIGKENEFGRVFQLGRISGNFMFVAASTSLRMDDKSSFLSILRDHQRLFGSGTLKSLSADKGYWSMNNLKALLSENIKEPGLQRPSNIKSRLGRFDEDREQKLANRRAGIEPLIGHVKKGGQLGRSRMKSDTATLAAGYASVSGFNLRQLIRYHQGKGRKAA